MGLLNALKVGLFGSVLLISFAAKAQNSDTTNYAIAMAESVIKRSPTVYGDWDYVTGTVLRAFQELYAVTGDEDYYNYIKRTVDKAVNTSGTIAGYTLNDYNIDEIREGSALLFLYQKTSTARYKTAADKLMSQLAQHPRTSEGGFWHKQKYPNQMWLDGLYMGSPFYAEYGKVFNKPEAFDDVANQILLMGRHIKDSVTGLYFHGWDESHQQEWADSVTGHSPSFWSRGMGWFAMAIVDVLDYLPIDHVKRDSILAIFSDFALAITQYQDTETGLWYQVTDKADSTGNYLEASGSAMFCYALAKGARLNYIPANYHEVAEKAYQGMIEHLITGTGYALTLNNICNSAGLGYGRDGSYSYYINETQKVSNDGKGIGPFILSAIEFSDFTQEPTKVNDSKTQIGCRLYPTPAKGNITLEFNLKAASNATLNLYNILGNPMSIEFVRSIPQGTTTIDFDIAHLKNGVYFLRIETDGQLLTQRFVVSD